MNNTELLKFNAMIDKKYGKAPNNIDETLDKLYTAINALIVAGSYEFLDELLVDKALQVWRMDLDVVLGWATATFRVKQKLPSREIFMKACYKFFPEKPLWDGLE